MWYITLNKYLNIPRAEIELEAAGNKGRPHSFYQATTHGGGSNVAGVVRGVVCARIMDNIGGGRSYRRR